jgi:pyruvate/2-oxoglutarate/acetoin dehydrogenase E1 component
MAKWVTSHTTVSAGLAEVAREAKIVILGVQVLEDKDIFRVTEGLEDMVKVRVTAPSPEEIFSLCHS